MDLKRKVGIAILVVAAVLLEATSLIQYWFARESIREEVVHRAQSELKVKSLTIQNALVAVEAAVKNMTWVVEKDIQHPDSMYSIARRLLINNPNIVGVGIVFKPNYYSVKAGDLYDVLSVILKSNFSLWLAFNVLEEGKILVGSDSELVEVENSFKSSINGLEKPTGVTSSLNSQSVYELKRSTISRRDELAKLYFDIYNSQKGALIYWDVILNAYLLVSDFERFISSRVLSYEMDEVGKCVLRERFEEDDILL